MRSFFQRLLAAVMGQRFELLQPTPAHGTPRAASASLPAATGATKLPSPWSVGVRRPLISSRGEVIGFEFRIGDETLQRLTRRPDPRAQAAHVSAMLAAARLATHNGSLGLVRIPAEWLSHTPVSGEGTRLWIGVEFAPQVSLDPGLLQAMAAVVRQLQTTGAKLGWDIAHPMAVTPDFVLLRQGQTPMPLLLHGMQSWPAHAKSLPVLATDIANLEDLELALHNGITYLCGALAPSGSSPLAREVVPVAPEVRRIGHLLNQLVTGADTTAIVSDIKGDVGLSYGLLRRINSAGFAQLGNAASIDQAVVLLGRNELYRWLSVLLVQFADRRKAASALQEIALWRSRLLELLAIENKEPDPTQLFTLGLASMLSPILKISLSDVVDALNLPQVARSALLAQEGPWHIYLEIANQLGAQSVADSPALAERFGGVERVVALSDQAWSWAAEHAGRNAAQVGGVGRAGTGVHSG